MPPGMCMIHRVGRDLPSGTVTFLFTDVEGSTRLLHTLGAEGYADALATHRRILRDAFTRHGGVEVDTQGDAVFVAFPTAPGALAAATEACAALIAGPIKVRIGLHTGTPFLTEEGYVGGDVHRAALIAAAGHGGQILVSSATAALLEASLRDLGAHRLKDLSAPERIFQADPDEHPPLKTISNTNLPHPASSFIGREREVEGIVARLRSGARLLTLMGPGGTGKTRLAIEAASALVADYSAGVFWVPLAALRDPDLVDQEIARIIGATESLPEFIGDREMLLVVDNLEQVIGAAPRLTDLVEDCPKLQLLVTSREVLRVRGEQEYAVSPLAQTDATELFEARSGISDPMVEEVCRRLDNLPLAVELAAARARILSPAEILERISARLDLFRGGRDADARQATLRSTIEWSHDLLTSAEQQAFARLGIFRGGWTLDAAEVVAEADLETLASLADKSLVIRSGERFRMLETIRAYAEERLANDEDPDAVRRRHFDHVSRLVEHWYAERLASGSRWLPIVAAENDNIRAALDWAHDASASDDISLAGAVAPLWGLHGQAPEAVQRLRAALAAHPIRDAARARALTHLGEFEDDVALLDEALAIWRELGERNGEALALEALGWVYDALGNYEASQAAHEQSLDVRRRAGAGDLDTLSARAGLCHVLVVRAETARARSVAGELLTLARANGAALTEELALHFLADCPLVDGDYREASDRYRRALDVARTHGLVGRATDEVLGIAMSLAGLGEDQAALRLAASAHAKQAELGKTADHWWATMQERLLVPARSRLPAGEVEAAEREGAATTFDSILDELLAPQEPA